MSVQRQDSNFEGLHALPITMRHQRGPRGLDRYPLTTTIEDVLECRRILGNESWVRPVKGLTDWFYDPSLMCWRWADHLLSDEEREAVRRAREACALEETRA